MIVCPNCVHQNPEGAINCEECYTELPCMINCPHCGTSILSNAVFCGSCGHSLQPATPELSTNNNLESESTESVNNIEPLSLDIEGENIVAVDPIASATVLPSNKTAKLMQVQTSTSVEIPNSLSVINIGKPNEILPPDIDVSGFPNSEIVSRVHARLIRENDEFFIEDLGSANGTYINHLPLQKGGHYPLKTGDQIALGKENKVTFIFQI